MSEAERMRIFYAVRTLFPKMTPKGHKRKAKQIYESHTPRKQSAHKNH